MKLAVFIVVVLIACANELVLSVKQEQDEAASAASSAPETLRETLANLLAPVLALLYIVALPLAFIALLCMFLVFAPALALALALMLLLAATGRLLRRKAGFSRVEFRGSQASEVPPCEPRTAPGSGRSRHCPLALHAAQALKFRNGISRRSASFKLCNSPRPMSRYSVEREIPLAKDASSSRYVDRCTCVLTPM